MNRHDVPAPHGPGGIFQVHLIAALWLCGGAAASLLLLELGLRALPVFGGVYAADPEPHWRAPRMVQDRPFTYSDGWNLARVQRGRINNYGYVAPFDYVPRTRGIVVLGDSYVESLMTPYRDTLQGSLGAYLDSPQPVLNFGVAGASLPDYAGVGAVVRQHFDPSWAVLVVTSRDFVEGFKRQPGYFHWAADDELPVRLRPRQPMTSLARLVRELALVRYARGNLKLSLGHLLQYKPAASPPCHREQLSDEDRLLLQRYLRALPAALGLPASRIILVFDSDRHAIYDGKSGKVGHGCMSRDEAARALLLKQAGARGMQVVATGSMFERFYRTTGQHLDYLPGDGHWNAHAHRLVAHRVAAIINADGDDLAMPGET